MTRVTTWEGVEYLVVTKVFCSIALIEYDGNDGVGHTNYDVNACSIKDKGI